MKPTKPKSLVQEAKELVATLCVRLRQSIQLTLWTASTPITKTLSLNTDGSLDSTATVGGLSDAAVDVVSMSPAQFAEKLNNVQRNECFSYGVPKSKKASRLVTKARYDHAADKSGLMARVNDQMAWPDGPGLLMLDYDPYGTTLSRDELLSTLYGLCPGMQEAAHIWAASASSCIYDATTGTEIRGIKGQRVYIAVADASDIPRAAGVLAQKAWLAGLGRIEVSQSGQALKRTIVDLAVFQPTRIDFVAPSVCLPPLEQRKPPAVLLGHDDLALDTKNALPDLNAADQRHYQQVVTQAIAAKATELAQARAKYTAERAAELVERGVTESQATATIRRALEHGVLQADFVLHTEDGETVTVAEMLRDRQRWHHVRMRDPIEPDYRDDERIARATLLGTSRPYIHSFAHGGQTFTLESRDTVVQLIAGQRYEAIVQIVAALKARERFFQRSGILFEITQQGQLRRVSKSDVITAIDQAVCLVKSTGKTQAPVPVNTPDDFGTLILDSYAGHFDEVTAVSTAPTIDPKTGRIVSSGGYDAGLSLVVYPIDEFASVPERPSNADIATALADLWWPVHQFPFATPLDESVMLTAMLTAAIRQVLPTAPAFALDAPVQGSGKTLLAQILAALAGGVPSVTAPTGRGDDSEMRKRIFASLLKGEPALIIDNVVGDFDSTAVATVLTSTSYSDRILGASQMGEVSTNTLVLITGNNLRLSGDLPRRALKCRIDPKCERPHARSFNFAPLDYVQQHRQILVAAALTLIKGYLNVRDTFQGQARLGKGRMASFETWDDVVRQTVCWLSKLQADQKLPSDRTQKGKPAPTLCDPAEAIHQAVGEDNRLSPYARLLPAWKRVLGTGPARQYTVAELIAKAHANSREHPRSRTAPTSGSALGDVRLASDEPSLIEVLGEIGIRPGSAEINSKSLGKFFGLHKDRPVDGLRLRAGESKQNTGRWWVEDLSAAEAPSEGRPRTTAPRTRGAPPAGQVDLVDVISIESK